ncbi:hypothetical protein BDV23DRAFT_65420 [Aspergillus alliaceus]|uniref:Uncharacterized protein n=1 Tax=Petromyces alliaceus TaxID=209559 RepID=A0A5N7CP64_PETAA|nr:hypothetical protein BDV23DRAFT_65420 [Aspergillus alliaceus]
MMTVPPPPPYMLSGSPPSYDEVAKKVDSLVGSNPSPAKYLDAATSLTEEERAVLQAGAEEHNPIKTDEDKKKYTVGAAQSLSTDEAKAKLKEEANTANKAARDIEDVFTSLSLKIAEIDNVHQSNFAPTLKRHRDDYRKVLDSSRMLAADISQYGASFDAIIVKFCADQNYTVDQRKERINSFIDKATSYQQQAENVKSDFQTLVDNFAGFVATFGDWAKDKEGELTSEIKKINEDLVDLNKTLGDLYIALMALGGALAVGLPVIGVGAVMAGPAAPLVIIGGLIFFGASAAAIAGIAISIGVIQGQIRNKTAQRDNLQAQIEQIQQTRQALQQLGEEKYTVLSTSIRTLSNYWTYTTAQAQTIKGWLDDGAQWADIPEYMEMYLNHGVRVYASLSEYLDAYAKGITTIE